MAQTVNERLLDATTNHAVDLQRYSNAVVHRIIGVLNRTDPDLFAQLTLAMQEGASSVERLDAMLQSVRYLNAQAYLQVDRELTSELRQFVEYEAGFQFSLFRAAVPPQILVQVDVAPVNVQQVFTAAYAQPFQGRLLKEWTAGIEAARMVRIRDAVRIAYVEQEPVAKIVQRLRGTRAKGYADGLLEIDRRGAETVARTAISHMAGVTRDRFIAANDDLVQAVRWVSTLDVRTSPLCRVRDGLRYTATEHKPIEHKVPWGAGPGRLHMACRSCSAPVVKSWRELGFDLDELEAGTRASMDGQVPADQTYGEWLQKQSAKRQDEILGETRGKLLRAGGLPVDRFFNDRGLYLTLDQLRERDAAAFGRAGL
jgi:hypothetical protein